MEKFQFSKTLKSRKIPIPKIFYKIFGIMLLCVFLLPACQKIKETPEPTTTNQPRFAKWQAWYNQESRKKTKNTSERLTGADTVWYQFEPKWEEAQTEALPEGNQIMFVPLHRNLRVRYTGQIGYIRRLVVYTDAQGNITSGFIGELFGGYADIQKNEHLLLKSATANQLLIAFDGGIITYNLAYEQQTGNHYQQGVAVGEAFFKPQKRAQAKKDKSASNPVYYDPPPYDWSIWFPASTSYLVIEPWVAIGGGGGSSYSDSYQYPDFNPLDDIEFFSFINPLYGNGSYPNIDIGDFGTEPVIPNEVSPELQKITHPAHYYQEYPLTPADFEKVDNALKKGLANPILKKAHKYMEDNGIKMIWSANKAVPGYAYLRTQEVLSNPENPNSPKERVLIVIYNPIVFKPEMEDKLAIVTWEELIHTCQNKFYGDATANANGTNMEFEAKFILEFLKQATNDNLFPNVDTALYDFDQIYNNFYAWLSSLTPQQLSEATFSAMSAPYWSYAEAFRSGYAAIKPNGPYSGPINQSLLPLFLFFLFNN